MKLGPDTTGLKHVQINKPTKSLFMLTFLVDLVVETLQRPPSTIRGFIAGFIVTMGVIIILFAWSDGPPTNDTNSDDDDDNSVPSEGTPTPRPAPAHA